MAVPTKEQLEAQRRTENLNRVVAFSGEDVPLFGGKVWIRLMTFRDAACLELANNPLVCGGALTRAHAFNFLAYMLGLRGGRAIFKRVRLRRMLDRIPIEQIRAELNEYSDMMWQDRVMPPDDGKHRTPRYSVHYCAHIAHFCASHYNMTYEQAISLPIPVFHQLRRAWYHANGREVQIMDKSDVMQTKIQIAQAMAERTNTNG